MKFVTNRIFFGQPKSSKVAEAIKAASSKSEQGQVKTASAATATPVKEAEVKVEANIKNLGTFAHPNGKKKKEAPKVEVEAETVKDEKKAGTVESVKVAEGKEEGVETYEAGKKEATEFTNDAEKKPEDGETPEKNAGKAATTTTKTQDGTFPSSGQPQWEGKPENNNKPEMPTDKNTEASSADDLLKKVLAGLDKPFSKSANLKPELKKDMKDYWRALYGEDYADAMVADK